VRTAANVALVQLGWFASVLGAAHGHPLLGPPVVALVLAVHFLWFRAPGDGLLVATSTLVGFLAESALLAAGLVSYGPQSHVHVPLWIVGLWPNFAIALNHSLSWLKSRLALSAVLGAIAGPAAYLGGARLGALALVDPVRAVAALALVWGTALPLLLALSREADNFRSAALFLDRFRRHR
jgi:Protein of unknown function (DUF2878)